MLEKTISIAPTTSILEAAKNQNLTFAKAFGELIDNSFDAGATRVQISIGGNEISVLDNGTGCSDVEVMLQQGRHTKRKGGGVGMYGVGLKDAAHWFWGTTLIFTSDGKKLRSTSARWQDSVDSGVWKPAEVFAADWSLQSAQEVGIPDGIGTLIRFKGVIRKTNVRGIESLVRELGFVFCPGLQNGKQIEISYNGKRFAVVPFRFPVMDERIDKEFFVKGKTVKLTAGIVKDGTDNIVKGHAIAYRHRIIQKTEEACGDFATSKFFGYVELGDGWRLARNKDSVTEDFAELLTSLEFHSRQILERAHVANENLAIESLQSELQSALDSAFEDLKKHAKRKSPENEAGAKKPTGTGTPHTRAKNRHEIDGKYAPFLNAKDRKVGGVLLQFAKCGIDAPFGRVQKRIGKLSVELNTDHPWVEESAKDRGNPAFLAAVMSLVSSFIASLDVKEAGELFNKTTFAGEDRHERFTAMMSTFLLSIAPKKPETIIAQQVA